MSILSDEIIKRIEQIDCTIAALEKRKSRAPEGRIRVSSNNGKSRYYLVTQDNGSDGKYLKRSEERLAQPLIQKQYENSVLKSLYKEREALVKVRKIYDGELNGSDTVHFFYGPEERIWQGLIEGRKQLAVPVIQDDESFIEEWLSEEYERKPFDADAPEYYTGSGIRVRSKTELIIADMLEKKGVPFYYEKPLILKGYGRIHPDFTVLNVKMRKTMYLEHMGMMDNEEYLAHALERINYYEAAGFYPGIDLILTHETSSRPVRTRVIEKMIEAYLL